MVHKDVVCADAEHHVDGDHVEERKEREEEPIDKHTHRKRQHHLGCNNYIRVIRESSESSHTNTHKHIQRERERERERGLGGSPEMRRYSFLCES